MTTAVEATLGAVATLGLVERDWPDEPPDPATWAAVLRTLDEHRLIGLAASAVESGRLVLSEDQVVDLAGVDVRAAAQTVTADASLLLLAEALDDARLAFRVLKGTAAARLDWSAPDRRRYVDTDVLLRPDDLARGVAAAERLGARRRVPELRPGFDRRFAKSVTMGGPAGALDLHRSLVLGPHCFLVRIDELWADPRAFDLCGRALLGLAAAPALVHYAMHATITGIERLGSLRDFLECGRHVDLDQAAAVASRWKATAIVQRACGDLRDRLGLTADQTLVMWGATLRPTDEERRLARAYHAASDRTAVLLRASLRYVPGVRDTIRFACAVAWPSKENRLARQRAAPEQAARLRRHLRRANS